MHRIRHFDDEGGETPVDYQIADTVLLSYPLINSRFLFPKYSGFLTHYNDRHKKSITTGNTFFKITMLKISGDKGIFRCVGFCEL
mgnify:CR=1 FL=1